MATLNVFVSFEFDKDNDLKNNFYRQAKKLSPYRVKNCSLKEAYPSHSWRQRARRAIEQCDAMVILLGEDTQNAPGVKTEIKFARRLKKPIFQVRPKPRPYRKGVVNGGEVITWRWKGINKKLDALRAGR